MYYIRSLAFRINKTKLVPSYILLNIFFSIVRYVVFMIIFSSLYAHGGGDLPEMCLRGILLAIENSRAGSILYVITDAPAKDYEYQVIMSIGVCVH